MPERNAGCAKCKWYKALKIEVHRPKPRLFDPYAFEMVPKTFHRCEGPRVLVEGFDAVSGPWSEWRECTDCTARNKDGTCPDWTPRDDA